MIKHNNKIIAGVIIAIVLSFVFWYGGDAPGLRGWTLQQKDGLNVVNNNGMVNKELPAEVSSQTEREEIGENTQNVNEIPIKHPDEPAPEENKPQNIDNTPMTSAEKEVLAERIAEENDVSEMQNGINTYSETSGMIKDKSTGKDKYFTDSVPEGKPIPIEPQDSVISDKKFTCTLSVRCDTILNNIAWLDNDKVDIVPKDGVIFAEKTVTFYEGESVFNLLMREMKRNKIHMEFENTPIYNSAYIEGIANLYEFDCGELSGWMYKVNDWFPNYGCSRYQLKAGDRVEWVYTCDLGVDVGGYYAAKGE